VLGPQPISPRSPIKAGRAVLTCATLKDLKIQPVIALPKRLRRPQCSQDKGRIKGSLSPEAHFDNPVDSDFFKPNCQQAVSNNPQELSCSSNSQAYSMPGPMHFHPSFFNWLPVALKSTSPSLSASWTWFCSSIQNETATPALERRTYLPPMCWNNRCVPGVVVISHVLADGC